MNLFIHGIDGKIELGNSYWNDRHPELKADYLLANPPFNDGSKGDHGWGADKVPNKDPRLWVGSKGPMPLAARNANPMWIMHFLYHLKEGGKAGFVMATGELSNSETSRKTVRQTLVEEGFVDCIVQLTGQLFHQTQIPCSLWFKGTRGQTWCKKAAKPDPVHRRTETRVVDSRLAEAERASEDEMNRVAAVYREYRHRGQPTEVPEFCRVAAVEEIRGHGFALTPGRYVGAEGADDSDEPFEEKILSLSAKLHQQFEESRALQEVIETHIRDLGHAG